MVRHGTTIGIGTLFAVLLLGVFAGVAAAADTLRLGGTGSALGTIRLLADGFAKSHPGLRVSVAESLGSSGGIKATIRDAIDVGLSARPLKPDEVQLGITAHLYATTPLALVTYRRDVVDGFSVAEVAEILAGTRTEWPDGRPLRIVVRPPSETDTKLLEAHSPLFGTALTQAQRRRELPVAFTDQDNMAMAEEIDNSLAFAALSGIVSERRTLATLPLDGVAPTLENVANGSYGLTKPFYFVLRTDASPIVHAFLRFIRSPEGEQILRLSGNLPVGDR